MLKKEVVLCGEGVGDEKHVRIRKRKKKVIEIHLELGGRGISFRVLKSVQILPFRYCSIVLRLSRTEGKPYWEQ